MRCVPVTPESPCKRCASFPRSSHILCRRGLVCDIAGLPYLCRRSSTRQGSSSPPTSPPPFPAAAECLGNAALDDPVPSLMKARKVLEQAKHRRHRDVWGIKTSGPSAENERHRRILVRVATTEVKDMRGYVYKMDGDFVYDFPYDTLIVKIVWELGDNPRAAQIIGVEDVEDLVALLEVASRCEAKYRTWETKVSTPLQLMQGFVTC